MTTGIIILAAGSSSRLGTPKQLLPYKGTTLLRHIAQTALQAVPSPVVVVLGAHAAQIRPSLDNLAVHVAENAQWQEGMASSIRCGLQAIQDMDASVNCVIFMVCDQPYISDAILKELVESHRATGKTIIACDYGGITGTPALFEKQFFPDLVQLKGDEGAKKIIRQHTDTLAVVPFPEGRIDIDTAADYEALK